MPLSTLTNVVSFRLVFVVSALCIGSMLMWFLFVSPLKLELRENISKLAQVQDQLKSMKNKNTALRHELKEETANREILSKRLKKIMDSHGEGEVGVCLNDDEQTPFSITEGEPNDFEIRFPDQLHECHPMRVEFFAKKRNLTTEGENFFQVFVFRDRVRAGGWPVSIERNPTGYPEGSALAMFIADRTSEFGWYVYAQAGSYVRMERFHFSTHRDNCLNLIGMNRVIPSTFFRLWAIQTTAQEERFYGAGSEMKVTSGEDVRLIIRRDARIPWPYNRDQMRLASFHARIQNSDILVPVDCEPYVFNDAVDGWICNFVARDPGVFELRVTLHGYSADAEPVCTGQLPSIGLGSHQISSWNNWHELRNQIWGGPFKLVVEPDPLLPPPKPESNLLKEKYPLLGKKTVLCAKVPLDEAHPFPRRGRWVNLPADEPCYSPICTSTDRDASKVSRDWSGHRQGWIWVPYDCHYRLFTPKEILQCAASTDAHWIHATGDSTAREPLAAILSMFPELGAISFTDVDETVDYSKPFRMSYEVFYQVTRLDTLNIAVWEEDQKQLDRRNLRKKNTVKSEAPDYFVFHPAYAYRAMKMPTGDFIRFARDLAGYIGEAVENGMNVVYYSPAFVYSRAHYDNPGESGITETRVRKFDRILESHMRSAVNRVKRNNPKVGEYYVFRASMATSSIPWGSYDGLHYLSPADYVRTVTEDGVERVGGTWQGNVGNMMMQALMNLILRDCKLAQQPDPKSNKDKKEDEEE
eukprot:TRINITY_DN7446_c0_g2_i1.p1 TRINITY_DN7446_c0_g2~~TRINITY_DN7446_c0_g2_i1.p1  ORF type:complete len:754 (-),score=89.87 TRINITY_DN7446_c0_g2_i1:13-2274(-)